MAWIGVKKRIATVSERIQAISNGLKEKRGRIISAGGKVSNIFPSNIAG